MQANAKTMTKAFLIAAAVFVAGCDTDTGKADKRVQQAVADSASKRAGYSDASVSAAITTLEKTIGESAAGQASKAVSRAALGQAEMDSANLDVNQLMSKHAELQRLVMQMNRLAGEIGNSNTLVAGFEKRNPAKTVASLQAERAAARGTEGKAEWITTGKGVIRTETATKADIARLEGEINKLKDANKALSADFDKALADASQADMASSAAKGQESVDLYKKGADFRKAAANMQNQIDVNQLALKPLEHDLSVAKGQAEVLQKTIAAYEEQLALLGQAWTKVQEKIAEQKGIVKALVEGKGAPAGEGQAGVPAESLAEKAAQANALLADIARLRETAERKLNDSATHFGDAATAADMLRTDLQKKQSEETYAKAPESATWKMLISVLDAGGFKLQRGMAERTLAEVQAAGFQSAKERQNLSTILAPILVKADMKAPAEMEQTGLEKEVEDGRRDTEHSFQTASDRFLSVAQGTSGVDRTTAAQVQRMLTLYAWAQFNVADGDKNSADQKLGDAVKARDEALAANPPAVLPPLPSEIAPPPPAAPAPAPATAPGNSPNAPASPTEPGTPAIPGTPAAPSDPAFGVPPT